MQTKNEINENKSIKVIQFQVKNGILKTSAIDEAISIANNENLIIIYLNL